MLSKDIDDREGLVDPDLGYEPGHPDLFDDVDVDADEDEDVQKLLDQIDQELSWADIEFLQEEGLWDDDQ